MKENMIKRGGDSWGHPWILSFRKRKTEKLGKIKSQ